MLKKTWVSGALSAVALTMASTTVNAQNYWNLRDATAYVGANVGAFETSIGDSLPDDTDITTFYGRLGMFFTPMISTEIRAGFGTDDLDLDGELEDGLEMDNFYGVYLRGGWQANNMFYPYAIVGYSWVETDLTVGGVLDDDTDDFPGEESTDDVSYGVGVDINFNNVVTINAEYLLLVDANAEYGGFTLGLSKQF